MKNLLLIFFGIFTLVSCVNAPEEIVLDDLSQQATKLVVVGFLSPQDSILAVKVSHSAPIGDSFEGSIVTNATVLLSSGNASIRLAYNAPSTFYQILAKKFPIKSGNTYKLTVETPDGQRVEGSCTVPEAVQLQRVTFDSSTSTGSQKQYVIRYSWQDPANQTNFYQVAGAFVYTKSAATSQQSTSALIVFGTPAHPGELVSDETANGGKLESLPGLLSTESATQGTFYTIYRQASITATLLHVDEAYYRYHKAIELATSTNGNPFAEPVTVPSNIKGGLGCFAGYSQAVVRVRLK